MGREKIDFAETLWNAFFCADIKIPRRAGRNKGFHFFVQTSLGSNEFSSITLSVEFN